MDSIESAPVWVYAYDKNAPMKAEDRIRLCALSYGKALGRDLPKELNIARTIKNKPFFENAPDIHFSISHSNALWALALSTFPVGIDVQHERTCDMQRIAKRFFHPLEQSALKKDRYASFFRIWAAKESYVKYTGSGITDDYASFSAADQDGYITSIGNVRFSFIPVETSCTLCLCSEATGEIIFNDMRL